MNAKTGISIDEVKHIAVLASLVLSSNEIEKLQIQLSAILEFVSKLDAVNAQKCEITSQVTGLKNVFREDIVTPSLPQNVVLQSAKQTHNGYFKVKAVFEE